MNPLLHIVIDEAFDLYQAGADAVAKNWPGAISNVMAGVEEVPALAASLPDAQAELKALIADPASDADLLTYVGAKFVGANAPATAKVAQVILTVADLLLTVAQKGMAVYSAVEGLSAQVSLPAPAVPAAPSA